MLKTLTINDLAVVRHVDIEFGAGLTVMTGETGAGKSILVDALGLALGDRADSSMVRAGAARASVTAVFDLTGNEAARRLLRDHELEDSAECIIRRVLNADGGSRAFCNAAPIPVSLLKEIGENFVDIHGQHAHHSLLRPAAQRLLLDGFGGLEDAVAIVRDAYAELREATIELEALLGGDEDLASKRDFLAYQLDEIDQVALPPGELDQLADDHRRLANAVLLIEGCDEILTQTFSDQIGVLDRIAQAQRTLSEMREYDRTIGSVADLFEQAAISLGEAERELLRFRSQVEIDPHRYEEIERRLAAIHDIARKHRCDAASLIARGDELRAEFEGLDLREAKGKHLADAIAAALARYERGSQELHELRVNAAAAMSKDVSRRLPDLGMPHGEFEVRVHASPTKQPSPTGVDAIEFEITANPDQPPRPLKKVASGGELSRISLAIQVTTAEQSLVPTLVYDEVDSGVGGRTAAVVGNNLRALADTRQILCITHLPQVASAGARHLSIQKTVIGGITETTVHELTGDARIDEIARMLGGRRITHNTRAHARDLLTI
jgi:DNA repair protein RecN (Recombination protein N)